MQAVILGFNIERDADVKSSEKVKIIFSSFTVESKYCVYTTEFVCENFSSQEIEMAVISFLLLIINLIYLIYDWLGKIPMPTKTLGDVA